MANLKDLIVNGSARILGTIFGNLTGNVTGNLTGNVTGNVTGNATSADKVKLLRARNSITNANNLKVQNYISFDELTTTTTNAPSADWFHYYTTGSPDNNYGSQLALGMTTRKCFHRNYSQGAWSGWRQFVFNDTVNTAIGSGTQGVYIDANGKVIAMTYTLGKSVPADAVFTDTVYTHPTTSGNKHIPSGGASGQVLGYSADGTATWITLDIPTTTSSVTQNSTAALTSGGAYTNLVTNVEAGSTANIIKVTKAGTATNITINNVASATNATNATNATKATQDASGNVITTTYAKKSTTLSGYGITDAYTKTEIDGKLSGAMHFKGTVANYTALTNISNPATGDMYNLTDTGANYAWNGSAWDKLSENVDLSGYVPTSRTINGKALTSNITLTASDVNASTGIVVRTWVA